MTELDKMSDEELDKALQEQIKETFGPKEPTPTEEVKKEEAPAYTAEDMAAYDFQRLVPEFWNKLEPLSRRQEQRVFMALIQYPLEGRFPKFPYQKETDAFRVGLQLFDCKFVLMKAAMDLAANKEKMAEFNKQLQEAKGEKTSDGL